MSPGDWGEYQAAAELYETLTGRTVHGVMRRDQRLMFSTIDTGQEYCEGWRWADTDEWVDDQGESESMARWREARFRRPCRPLRWDD